MTDYRYNAGDDLRDADWVKSSSWDFFDLDGKITRGVDRLLEALGLHTAGEEDQQEGLRKFLELPAAKPMPAKLREEVDRFIREGRTRDASS